MDERSERLPSSVRLAMPLLVLGLALVPAPASAKSHLWRMNEFFSDATGTIQFIEFANDTPAMDEVLLNGSTLESNTILYDPGQNLVGDTAFKKLLMATQGFADLPSAPTPDFILPDNFFDPSSDTLRYIVVVHVVGIQDMPTDGFHSVDRSGAEQINTPTNFAGDTATINLPAAVPAAPLRVLIGGTLALVASGCAFLRVRSKSWR